MNFNILKTKVFLTLTAMMISAFFIGNVYAQVGTSGVNGTVTDQNGAAVPGATVRLVNPETGFSRTVTTSDQGVYSFPGIPPATYRVEVEAANFKKTIKSNVQALVDNPVEANIALEPGDINAVVDVTADTIQSVVNTQDASIGNNFVPEQITQLPTNLRRVNDLLTLQPGVTREGYVAGGRSDQANITLDGVDINDQQTGGRSTQFQTSQASVLRAVTESVEEFRITTLNPNANQGRSSGAQISLVTKSGTNDFHGSVFYFYRPTAFSANDFFNNLSGVERPSLARDVFGGAVGGPIVRDRFFFFYAYEGQREQRDVSVVRLVPLAHLGQGQLRFRGSAPGDPAGTSRLITLTTAQLNQIYSQVGINPAAVAALGSAASRYTANDTSLGDGLNTGGFRFNSSTSDDENTHIARFDYRISDSQSLFLRGNYQYDLNQGTSQFPDTPHTAVWDHPYGFVVGHNWTISNNKVNNFRYGLTRQAFSTQGDSSANAITFRFVFSPLFFSRTLSRVTPTHNFTDDFTWIKGNHTIQFGGNVRIIRNQRQDLANAFDSAVTNPSFYDQSGAVLDAAIRAAGYSISSGDIASVQAASAALIGRFSQYSGNFTFDIDGSVLPAGTPTERTFATEEYDFYGQDIWKPSRNLTLTFGLRYSLSRPVYEKNGFQVVPSERLGDFFDRRVAGAARGNPVNDLIQFELGGPANDAPGFYSMDWNNWQPSVAAAWSPSFESGFLRTLFGKEGDSVIRGGFRILNDHFGQQLAVSFDALSSIGFTSSNTIAANTYNVTSRPAPLFTGFNQDVRSLPGIPAPTQRFMTPADEAQRIESSLDATIKSPIHYTWNVTYGRQLPGGMYFEAAYVGRAARNLMATRDIMALNNLKDPASGLDWYTAAGMVHDLRAANVPFDASSVNIAYFNNLFPNLGPRMRQVINDNFGFDDPTFATLNPTQTVLYLVGRDGYDILDWTFIQTLMDDESTVVGRNAFFHPQYAAFSAFSTVARSDYHGAVFTLRQRLGKTLSYDLNYTYGKSMDDASGLQTGTSYGSLFILNPLRQEDNYSYSDFDTRHVVNANFLFQFPFGKGQPFFTDMNAWTDAFLGGWQLAGVFRWNSALPLLNPIDQAQWATNWNAQSSAVRIRPIQAANVRSTQNAFANPQEAFNSFRNARPGETGDRNVLRGTGYSALDLGLSKSFTMPWSENHKFQVRMEVFNVANIQYLNDDNYTRSTAGLPQDPETGTAPSDFGKIYTSIKGSPRAFQFGVRYSF